MGLLTPLFLAGLVALAVPLLIHLIRRERHDAIAFPSLMFLSRIPQPVVKRRRIRNWLLFALRCMALILLAGAFARPFIDADPVAVGPVDATREVVILLDRSYSMGYGDRWERAVGAAREAVDALAPGHRASLVLFDAGARMAVSPTTDRARLRAALDSARVSASVTRYTPALKLAQNVLAASEMTQREAILISDFQRAGWEGAAGAQMPAGAVVRPVHIDDASVANVTVTHVALARARVAGRERVSPVAHLANSGSDAARVTLTFETDGRVLQTVQADVPASGTSSVALQPVTLEGRPVRATVRSSADALPVDNAFHFMLEASSGLRVMIVEPAARSGAAGRDASLYLSRALELAEQPPFIVSVARSLPSAAELERTDVVVLNDMLPPDGEAGRRLVDWVKAGGGVVLAMGDRTATTVAGAPAREIMAGTADRVVDRVDDGGARLGFLEYSHPVFELFRAPRAGAFGTARFYRYRPVPAPDARAMGDTSSAGATVLARFDDGSIALVERPLGAGRALVWGTTLDAYWTNLALEPVYLPLVHQVVKRAAGFTPARPSSMAGQIVDVAVDGQAELVVNTPRGGRIGVTEANTLVTLEEQGFYEVREARAGGSTLRHLAVNVDVAESDLGTIDPAELVSALTVPAAETRSVSAAALDAAEREKRQSLWWYLLVIVFGLLTVEVLFANRRPTLPALP